MSDPPYYGQQPGYGQDGYPQDEYQYAGDAYNQQQQPVYRQVSPQRQKPRPRQMSNSRGKLAGRSRSPTKSTTAKVYSRPNIQKQRSPARQPVREQSLRGDSPTQRQSQQQYSYAPPQQSQYMPQPDGYYQDDIQRPTLKDEDYYNMVDKSQKKPMNRQKPVKYSKMEEPSYLPVNDGQIEYVQVPGYEQRQDEMLQNNTEVQYKLQSMAIQDPMPYAQDDLKPIKKDSKTAYRNAQKARIRNRSRSNISENSIRSANSPRNQMRQPKRQSPKRITPSYQDQFLPPIEYQPVIQDIVQPEYIPRLNPAAVPVMKPKPRSDSRLRTRDVQQMQDAINKDYEDKLRHVNEEAQENLRRVQQEHQDVILDSQRKFIKEKSLIHEQESMYDEMAKQFNQINQDSLINDSNQFKYSDIAPIREYRPSRVEKRRPDSRGSRGSRGTIGMLNSSYGSLNDMPLDDNVLNNSNLTAVLNQERDPAKLRQFYKEFCEAVKNNQRRDSSGKQELNIHDLLQELGLIVLDNQTNNRNLARNRLDDVNEQPKRLVGALSTQMIRAQKDKFYINSKDDLTDSRAAAAQIQGEDNIKNLFKVLCGVMNMPLKQRGMNPIENKVLSSYLDSINPEVLDDDIVLLNQLASIKSLANRRAFSLSDKQISMIHCKFQNMFDQRRITPAHERYPAKSVMSPSNDNRKNLTDRRQSGSRGRAERELRPQRPIVFPEQPKELQQMELEESREYRNVGINISSDRPPRKDTIWGQKEDVPFTDRTQSSNFTGKAPVYGVGGGLYKPQNDQNQQQFESYRPPYIEQTTDRKSIGSDTGRSNTNIGKGSRYASPPKYTEEPKRSRRDTEIEAGGGGAIISNYYGKRTNTSFLSEPESSAYQGPPVPPLNILKQRSPRRKSRSRSRSPKKGSQTTMPSMDQLQNFLNKAPQKNNEAEEKYKNMQGGSYAQPLPRNTQDSQGVAENSVNSHSFTKKMDGFSQDFQKQFEQMSSSGRPSDRKQRKSTRFEEDSIRDRNDSRMSRGSQLSHGGYDLS